MVDLGGLNSIKLLDLGYGLIERPRLKPYPISKSSTSVLGRKGNML